MQSLVVLAALVATACANYYGGPVIFPSKGGFHPMPFPIHSGPIFGGPILKGGPIYGGPVYGGPIYGGPIMKGGPIYGGPIMKGGPIYGGPIMKGGPIYSAPTKGFPIYSKGIQQHISQPIIHQQQSVHVGGAVPLSGGVQVSGGVRHEVVVDNSLMNSGIGGVIGGDDVVENAFDNEGSGLSHLSGISTGLGSVGVSTGVSNVQINTGISNVGLGSVGHFDHGLGGHHAIGGISQPIISQPHKVPTIGGVY